MKMAHETGLLTIFLSDECSFDAQDNSQTKETQNESLGTINEEKKNCAILLNLKMDGRRGERTHI